MSDTSTIERLTREVHRLRHKISPMEDVVFTSKLKEAMKLIDMRPYQRSFRGRIYYMVDLGTVWAECFGTTPNRHDLTMVGRSLQALLWERSALHGNLRFVKPIEEYEEDGY